MNGSERHEIRHISDCKIAYLRQDVEDAQRPKRGRPSKAQTNTGPDGEAKDDAATSGDNDKSSHNNKQTAAPSTSPNLGNNNSRYNLRQKQKVVYSEAVNISSMNRAGNSKSDFPTSAEPKAWVASELELNLSLIHI